MKTVGWMRAGSGQISISRDSGQRPKYGVAKAKKKKQSSIGAFRLRAILLKFNAGKKLTNEEMTYLQREQPKTFIKVRQIQAERTLLEKRSKAAEEKEKMADACLSSAKGVEREGKKGASHAAATARESLSQTSGARRRDRAAKDVQAKSRAALIERKKLLREEQASKMEEQRGRIEETIERQEAQRRELAFSQEEEAFQEAESKIDKAKDMMEDVERLKRAGRRMRKKVAIKNQEKSSRENSGAEAIASREELRDKLRKLIQENQDYKESASKAAEAAQAPDGQAGSQSVSGMASGSSAPEVGSMVDISL